MKMLRRLNPGQRTGKMPSLGGLKGRLSGMLQRQKPTEADADRFIACDNVVKIYKVADIEVMALQGLELQIRQGDLMAIIGSSGSGKSTLLNILGGLDAPTIGRASVAGWDLNQMSYRDKLYYHRHIVGFVWQNIGRNLVPYLTAYENVRLPMILGGRMRGKEWAKELLVAVGLKDRMNHRPLEMSGGQQQRVAIAVGLANQPDVLLADEPTGSLDSKTGSEILQVFRTVCREFQTTVIVVTHDRSLAKEVNRVVEIRDGKISTESVRTQIERASAVVSEDDNGSYDLQESADHLCYTVLDSAGRLQIPEEYLRELGFDGRAALEKEDGCIVIRPVAS